MIRVAISGIPGRLATATAAGIAASDDVDLVALYNPNRGGDAFNGMPISANHDDIKCDVVFESTAPTVVMGNLRAWRKAGHVPFGVRMAPDALLRPISRSEPC